MATALTPAPVAPLPRVRTADRVARAEALTVRPGPPSHPYYFRVAGGAREHVVSILPGTDRACDCGDYTWRRVVCKHQEAVRAYLLRH